MEKFYEVQEDRPQLTGSTSRGSRRKGHRGRPWSTGRAWVGEVDREGHSRWQGQGEQRLSSGGHWAGPGN